MILLALLALRVPIGVAMLAVGVGGFIWIQGLAPLLSFLKTTPFETFAELFLLGDPAVPADGQCRLGLRTVGAAVPRRQRAARPPSRRHGDGGGRRLRRFRHDLRLLAGHRGHHGAGGAAGDAQIRLFRRARHRHARRRRHARHPGAAVDPAGRLRHPDRAEHRQAVPGGLHPGGLAVIGFFLAIRGYSTVRSRRRSRHPKLPLRRGACGTSARPGR